MAGRIKPVLCTDVLSTRAPEADDAVHFYAPIMSPTDALVMILGSNLKPDCGFELSASRSVPPTHVREKLTAPTAIVCVAAAVEELETDDASMAVGRVVVLLELDVEAEEEV